MMKESKPKTNLVNILLLFLSAAVMIVGVHQTIINGFGESYWIFMVSIALFLFYLTRKNKQKQEENTPKLNRRAKRYMDRNH